MAAMSTLRGSAWNAAGLILPLAAGLYAVPQIIKLLGDHAAGILMLIWGLIGYFSLFDFGLGRAVTQRMATHYAAARSDLAAHSGITAMFMLIVVGSLAGLLMYLLEPYFSTSWQKTGDMPSGELSRSLIYVAWTLPLVVIAAGLRGVLEAENRFAASNLIRLPLGIWTFLSPVFAARTGASFSEIIFVLMIGRVAATVAYAVLTVRPLQGGRFDNNEFRFLAGFGGWMTVSNLVSPIMTQLDRYLIAFLLSATAVTYFVTPYEIVMRIQSIAAAVTAAYLPRFTASFLEHKDSTRTEYLQAHRLVLLPTVFSASLLYLYADNFMSLWIGPEFSLHSSKVMQVLCIGIIFNSQAAVPYTLLQAAARPKLIALNHLFELPVYLAILWFATSFYGLIGAAVASTTRVMCDYFLLQWQCARLPAIQKVKSYQFPNLHLIIVLATIITTEYFLESLIAKLFIFIVFITANVIAIFPSLASSLSRLFSQKRF